MAPTTSLLLWLLLCGFSLGAGTGRPARFVIYAKENNSVMIPGVRLTDRTYHELLKEGGTSEMVAIYHGGPMLVDIYEDRGQFFLENGSFQLHNLTKTDSGTYKHLVNTKIRVETKLIVIGPVETPILKVLKEFSGNACRIMLQCVGSGEHPLLFSFWRYQLQLDKNVTQMDNSSLLLLDRYVPESWGTYTCCLENPVSRKMSVGIQVQARDIEDCKKPRKSTRTYILLPFFAFGAVVLLAVMYCICYLKSQEKRTMASLASSNNTSDGTGADEETRLESAERDIQGITGDADDPDAGSDAGG